MEAYGQRASGMDTCQRRRLGWRDVCLADGEN